jgi:glutaredoxin
MRLCPPCHSNWAFPKESIVKLSNIILEKMKHYEVRKWILSRMTELENCQNQDLLDYWIYRMIKSFFS